jgi:nucleotide-binding universal stress UspA family protein
MEMNRRGRSVPTAARASKLEADMSEDGGDRALIVGVDGSKESAVALEWAATEARALGTAMIVCLVSSDPTLLVGPVVEEIRARGRAELERLREQAAELARDVPVTAEFRIGHPAGQLLALASPDAEIVVGHRGTGGFAGLPLGSVGAATAAHAAGPVVVVRPAFRPDGPVLVGLDRSDRAPRTLTYAFRHAARHGIGVQALHVLRDPLETAALAVSVADVDHRHRLQAAARYLDRTVSAVAADFPGVPVEWHPLGGPPARTLVEASRGAGLVVVGRRGHGGFPGLHLGSVSQAVLRHADCPVAVVP